MFSKFMFLTIFGLSQNLADFNFKNISCEFRGCRTSNMNMFVSALELRLGEFGCPLHWLVRILARLKKLLICFSAICPFPPFDSSPAEHFANIVWPCRNSKLKWKGPFFMTQVFETSLRDFRLGPPAPAQPGQPVQLIVRSPSTPCMAHRLGAWLAVTLVLLIAVSEHAMFADNLSFLGTAWSQIKPNRCTSDHTNVSRTFFDTRQFKYQ